ncbi:MAG: asparagine synthase (glutamine-hydrolyzing) [Chloroflexota bacterium]
MCGIAGVLQRQIKLAGIQPTLRAMGQQILHRGPDDQQFYIDDSLGLVFNRLSIVDVEGGNQPLTNEDGSLMLAVNGEIYNHAELRANLRESHMFKSASDCEVILHLYEEMGLDFIHHLNGMYAIVLWDTKRQQLIIVRDRLGIKPIYYHATAERLIFGSEIKSLFPYPDCPRDFDWQRAIRHDLSEDKPSSFFRGIEYLPAGHLLIADLRAQRIAVESYWNPSFGEQCEGNDSDQNGSEQSDQDLIDGYGALLADAVKLRLMADVEIGIFLSGGIDSVSVAALAAKYQHLHTFSVLSQSTLQNGDARSAYEAAKCLQLPNHQLYYPWQDTLFSPQHWKQVLWSCETPFCNPEHLYKFYLHRYARQARPDLKVILLGQGSDEFNGGYTTLYGKDWASALRYLTYAHKQKHIQSNYAECNPTYRSLLSNEFLALADGQPWHRYVSRYRTSLQAYNLWHEDRTAMANHIESRVPFLDHRLVEYTLSIPPAKYKRLFWNKRILREAMQSTLPESLYNREKVPFFIGDDLRYTRRMMYSIFCANDFALVRESLEQNPVFDADAILRLTTNIPNDPEYTHVDELTSIINMGLLAKMAREITPAQPNHDSWPLLQAHTEVDDWEQMALQLAVRRNDIDLDASLCFTPGSYLVKIDNVHDATNYLVAKHSVEYQLDSEPMADWINVLRRIDGRRSLRDILAELSLPEAAVRKQLEEAMDYKVIQLL